MQRKIRIMRASYPDIQAPQWEGRRLRGFFAAGQEEGSLLHNHGEKGRELYRYPLVQYKVLRRVPTVVALEEGIPEVYPLVMERQELRLGDRVCPCGHLEIALSEGTVGDAAETFRYRFLSPWFGLNQENYRRYQEADEEEKKQLLRRVLTGNLLSLSKGLGITVQRRLEAEPRLEERAVRFKEETVMGFVGEFSANFLIPDLLGLGKSVSRGFGAVKRVRHS